MIELGNNIRFFREKKGYTLKQLAESSGLSIGFISQVERAQTEPSIASLKKISMALDIKMRDLFDQDDGQHEVVRKGQGDKFVVHSVQCELLASLPDKLMEPLYKSIEPGGGSGGLLEPHDGEEFIWIMSGSLNVTVGDVTHVLHEGDSIYFKSEQPHSCVNKTNKLCEVLWISSPPMYT